MKLKNLSIAYCVLISTLSILAQANGSQADPISGSWGADGATFLDLKFDGNRDVSGTVRWGRADNISAIKTGTFDPNTGSLKLEGEAKAAGGAVAHYVIQGKVDKDTVTGTYHFGSNKGEFTFTKKKQP